MSASSRPPMGDLLTKFVEAGSGRGVLHGCRERGVAGWWSHPPVRDHRVVRGMSEVLVGREPVLEATRAPLIELAGVEKVYRTGKV